MRKWFKPNISLFSPEVHRDPYPFYDGLRREHPVFYNSATNFWLVSRYADVNAVLKNSAVFSTRNASFENTLLGVDGSAHARMRRIVGPMFNTTRVAALVDAMRSLVDGEIDRIAASGKSEVITDLARPLTVNTVSWLLEIDGSRVQDLLGWSEDLSNSFPEKLDEAMTHSAWPPAGSANAMFSCATTWPRNLSRPMAATCHRSCQISTTDRQSMNWSKSVHC